jgi:hypothetical protein
VIVPADTAGQAPPDRGAPDAASVRLSISEINALCFRAARGAGLAWGEAEEAGWAASRLSQAGLAGPAIALAWLRDLAELARPVPAPNRWPASPGPQCPVRCGIALTDFAGLPEGPGHRALTVEKMAHPLMALPFVAGAARRTARPLRARWAKADVTLDPAEWRLPQDLGRGTSDAASDVRVAPAGPRPPTHSATADPPPIRGITTADKAALDALALGIAVPATSRSRSGAGAAGGDND